MNISKRVIKDMPRNQILFKKLPLYNIGFEQIIIAIIFGLIETLIKLKQNKRIRLFKFNPFYVYHIYKIKYT